MNAFLGLSILSTMLSTPGVAREQHRGLSVDLLAWVDSVAGAVAIDDFEGLKRRWQDRTGGEVGVARGWWLVRHGLSSNDWSEVESGVRYLVAERSARQDSPLPAYLLARTFHDLAVSRAPVRPNVAQRDGESNAETYWRLQRALVESHPHFIVGRQLASAALVASGDRIMLSDQSATLKRLRNLEPRDARIRLVEGRRLRTAEKLLESLTEFDHALNDGGDLGVLNLERAYTLAALGDATGAVSAYWKGNKALTVEGRAAYRLDLAWFVHPDTLAPFDSLPTEAVAEWLAAFWAERDALAANAPGERLEEQLRRRAQVFRAYRVPTPWRRTQFARVEYLFEELDLCLSAMGRGLFDEVARLQPADLADTRGAEPLLDHRGLVTLRHGSPVRRVPGKATAAPAISKVPIELLSGEKRALAIRAQQMAESMRFNESWLYWIDGRWRVLSFRGSQALGIHAPTTLMSYLPLADPMGFRYTDDWELRAGISDAFANAAARIRHVGNSHGLACDPVIGLAVTRQREDATVGVATDSDAPPISAPWNAAIQVYGLGHDANSGKALVALAIPGDRLQSTRSEDSRYRYSVKMRVVAHEREHGRIVTLDTTVHYMTRDSLRRGTFLNQLFEIPLQEGRWRVAVKLMQTADTAGAYAVLPALSIGPSAGLGMSDIVMGRTNGAPWTTPGGDAFPINTLGTWSRTEEAAIYYEVYGARAGDSMRTRVDILSLEPDRDDDRISVAFTEIVGSSVVRVERRLGLAQLRGGQYEVVVTIDVPGESISRRQRLIVIRR